jgi:hypothetical protein
MPFMIRRLLHKAMSGESHRRIICSRSQNRRNWFYPRSYYLIRRRVLGWDGLSGVAVVEFIRSYSSGIRISHFLRGLRLRSSRKRYRIQSGCCAHGWRYGVVVVTVLYLRLQPLTRDIAVFRPRPSCPPGVSSLHRREHVAPPDGTKRRTGAIMVRSGSSGAECTRCSSRAVSGP